MGIQEHNKIIISGFGEPSRFSHHAVELAIIAAKARRKPTSYLIPITEETNEREENIMNSTMRNRFNQIAMMAMLMASSTPPSSSIEDIKRSIPTKEEQERQERTILLKKGLKVFVFTVFNEANDKNFIFEIVALNLNNAIKKLKVKLREEVKDTKSDDFYVTYERKLLGSFHWSYINDFMIWYDNNL